jgi:hypothetical protein
MTLPLNVRSIMAFLAMAAAFSNACAGPVSLEPGEIQQLRTLVRADPAAAAQFNLIRASADRALVEQPAPIAHVVSEGHLATDPRKAQTIASLEDLPKTEALAWTWAVTGDSRYLAKAREFLVAWAKVNQPDGDPINETNFEAMIVAYDLTRGEMPQPDRALVEAWLRGKAEKLMAKPIANNNWGGHAAKTVGLIGLTLNDEKFTVWAVRKFKTLIEIEFHPDGSTTDFYERDALHYQLYAIKPLLALARAEARDGVSLFDYAAPSGATLQAGVDFVVPFAEGKKTHIEFVHSKVKFDRERAEDGESEYVPHPWDPQASVEIFCQAAWFQPEYGVLAAKIANHPGQTYFNWPMVVNAVSRGKQG